MTSFIEQTGMQVISGGQTGVDLAALRVAQMLGFRTGGAAPRNFITQNGKQPSLAMFGMHESASGYGGRTEENVVAANATLLIFVNGDSPGTKQTRKLCQQHERPCLELNITVPINLDDVGKWIRTQAALAVPFTGGFVLNVAGNSSTSAPGIFHPVFNLMLKILKPLITGPSAQDDIDRNNIFNQFNQPQFVAQLADQYTYVPALDFRNRMKGVPVDTTAHVVG